MKILSVLILLCATCVGMPQEQESLETAVSKLKQYENVSEPEATLKQSEVTSKMARTVLAEPKPSDEAKAKEWDSAQDYAKQVDTYSDYALFNQVTKTKDARSALMLTEALEKRSPKSPYLPQASNATFFALRQSGQIDQAVALAERALSWDPQNEEMLIVIADHYMKKNDSAKVLTYSTKLVEVMNEKQKPEQVSDADWTKRKNTLIGAGNWMAGMTYASQSKLADADKTLRAALPLLTDDQMKAGALYQLGYINFKLGESSKNVPRIQEAYRFSQQSAAIKSPYAANASKNAAAIRAKYKVSEPVASKKKK